VILYCATSNAGKLAEFRLAAGDWTLEPLPNLPSLARCAETGVTFEENAVRKALYYSRHAPGPLFADDSGLVVDALEGAPGVRSARFAGDGATDADNNRLLVERMRGVAGRRARFVSVVALALAGELLATFRGEVEGVLLEEPRGAGGFGYDPLFFCPPLGRTLAEIDAAEKLAVSHRGRALAAMFGWLAARAGTPPASWRR
jgi:XTP/dITP diphosphohydrolase